MVLARSRGDGAPAETLWRSIAIGAAQWYPWAIVAPFVDWWVRRARPAVRLDRARVLAGHAGLLTVAALGHGAIVFGMDRLMYPQEPAVAFSRSITRELIPDTILYA